MTVFIFPCTVWRAGALHRGGAVPVSARQLCFSQTVLRAARDGPFWVGLHPRPCLPALPQQAAMHVRMHSRLPLIPRSEGKGWCAVANSRISWPPWVVAVSFKGLLKGSGKCTNFMWILAKKMNFPHSVPGGVKCISQEKQSPITASLEMGLQSRKDFTILRPEGSCWSPPFFILLSSPQNKSYLNLDRSWFCQTDYSSQQDTKRHSPYLGHSSLATSPKSPRRPHGLVRDQGNHVTSTLPDFKTLSSLLGNISTFHHVRTLPCPISICRTRTLSLAPPWSVCRWRGQSRKLWQMPILDQGRMILH